jgi:hypothetical protein
MEQMGGRNSSQQYCAVVPNKNVSEVWNESSGIRPLTNNPMTKEQILNPGDWLIIAIQFDKDLDDSEACHQDMVFEDFLNNPKANWKPEIRGIERTE